MKILGIKTAYRLTKQKVMTAISVVVVMGLCCVSAIAVDALLNFSDVQALRVDPDDVIDYYDVIPEEYAPDRENNGIKTPVTSDTKAAQKMDSNEQTTTESETEAPETSESSTETEEESTETAETSETTEETTETTSEPTTEATTKPKQTTAKPTETAFKKTVYARTTVNIRTGPGTSYKVVRKATMWQAINVVAKTSNGWYKTSDGCYVKQSLTTLSTPKPTATPKPKSSKSTTKPTAKKTTTTTKKTTVKTVNGVKCKITFYGPVLYKRKDGSTFYSTTTATGTKCKQGRTCAADWSVFPKNSWVYIENDPLGGDGLYKVEDTGRFKGNWIDIYVDSAKGHNTCYRKVYQQ